MPIVAEERSAGKRRHPGWLVLPVLVVIVVTAFVAFQVDAQEARALRTPGAVVAVTRGNEPLVLGTAWQKWLLPRYPHLAEQIGGTIYLPQGGSAKQFVVWVNSGPHVRLPMIFDAGLTLIDEQGKAVPVQENYVPVSYIIQGAENTPGRNYVGPYTGFVAKSPLTSSKRLLLRFPGARKAGIQPSELVFSDPAL
jgi:hypothetical protein